MLLMSGHFRNDHAVEVMTQDRARAGMFVPVNHARYTLCQMISLFVWNGTKHGNLGW